jgi:hypothetical protein
MLGVGPRGLDESELVERDQEGGACRAKAIISLAAVPLG